MKTTCKEKFKRQIEHLENTNAESSQLRLKEIERNIRELHGKDLEVLSEKFELRLKTGFLEISEHETIVRQMMTKDRD